MFEADHTIWDGRFTNNAWLQELPKPLTKAHLGQCRLYEPRDGSKIRRDNQRHGHLKLRGRSVEAPVYLQPGQPDNGRRHLGLRTGSGRELA